MKCASAKSEQVLRDRIPVTLNHFSRVMAGQQPVEDGRERPYVPAIHALLAEAQQKKT
jgi:hypothetical protein